MTVVLVDWLGRGGIAQTTMSWRRTLREHGAHCVVATREGRELRNDAALQASPRRLGSNALVAHDIMVRSAARAIAELRPDHVIVQNYVIPAMEWKVYRAARRVGARVATVVHDHRLHSRFAGTGLGLRRALLASDEVLTHSRYVADRLASAGRVPVVLPHPVQLDMLETHGTPLWAGTDQAPLAVHFGVLKRRYKGTDVVSQLAADPGTRPWRFAAVGVGAPPGGPRLHSAARYVPTADLVATVRAADAVLLPYTHATQSGAVVLAQSLGRVCLASAVGGIPEQIADGATGLLLPAGAPAGEWAQRLAMLGRDAAARARLEHAARQAAFANHAAFAEGVRRLVWG